MKKLILLALAALGIGVLIKNRSEQLKAGAAKVTSDPRVQSALATATERTAPLKEKAAPYAHTVAEKAGPVASTVKDKVDAATHAAQEKLHHAQVDGTDITAPDAPHSPPEG